MRGARGQREERCKWRCQSLSAFVCRLTSPSTKPPQSVLPVKHGVVDCGPQRFRLSNSSRRRFVLEKKIKLHGFTNIGMSFGIAHEKDSENHHQEWPRLQESDPPPGWRFRQSLIQPSLPFRRFRRASTHVGKQNTVWCGMNSSTRARSAN